jgi:photosystem I P700 chlorophyll a apoprotein A1
MLGSLTIIIAHHMYAIPYYILLSITQHIIVIHTSYVDWSFCIVGGAAHGSIFMVRDYDATQNYNNLLDRVIRHRDAIISHLNWVCIFLGCHAFGFYIHNDTMQALGRPQDMFSDKAISLQPIFCNGFKGYIQLHWNNISKCISNS